MGKRKLLKKVQKRRRLHKPWTIKSTNELFEAVDKLYTPGQRTNWSLVRQETPLLQHFTNTQLRYHWYRHIKEMLEDKIKMLQEQVLEMHTQTDYFIRFFKEYNFDTLLNEENMENKN